MSSLHVNYSPAMTAELVSKGAFRESPFTVVDVGARGGVASYWHVFGEDLRIVGFDMDTEECQRLNALDQRVRYLPVALGKMAGQQTVYVANNSAGTSLYRTDPRYFARFTAEQNQKVDREITVETIPLSSALQSIGQPDFIKLDAEGAELEILQGGQDLLKSTLGILTEVRFTSALSRCPIFWEVEKYMREHCFELFDLDVYRLSRRSLPYPYLYSNYYDDGRPAAGPSTQGQVLWGDALYLRDFLRDTKSQTPRTIIGAGCLFEIFGLNDCAAELILAHRSAFAQFASPDKLLDLLVPEVKASQLTYKQYMNRDIIGDALLRPSSGKRFPETIISQYDGHFTPSWHTSPTPPTPNFWERLKALFG